MFVNAAGRYLKRCVTICLWTACAGRGYRLHLQKFVDLGSSIGSELDCCVARSKDFGSLNLRFLPWMKQGWKQVWQHWKAWGRRILSSRSANLLSEAQSQTNQGKLNGAKCLAVSSITQCPKEARFLLSCGQLSRPRATPGFLTSEPLCSRSRLSPGVQGSSGGGAVLTGFFLSESRDVNYRRQYSHT